MSRNSIVRQILELEEARLINFQTGARSMWLGPKEVEHKGERSW
jgi:hypothetical protein